MLIAQVNVARNFRGGERQTELLMTELDRLGIEQRLVARQGSMLARRMKDRGFTVREVSGHLPGVVMATRGADLVHVHEGRSIYAAYLQRLLSRTPYVATRRVNNLIGEHRFAHLAYCGAAKVVAVAPQVADVVRAFDPAVDLGVILSSSSGLQANPDQVRAIREATGNRFLVGHVGALDNDQKAQETIIEAARSLAQSHPDLHFMLVGGGEDEEMLRRLGAGLDNLTFTGFVDNVGDYLGAFDVFILPSRREGIGSILFDAMEFSLPLVVTPVGGVPRIVLEGQNGFLIEVERPDQLADRILRLKSDPALRERMGEQGRQMAIGHTPPDMARAYVKVYESILER
ncbi:MAG TPA: glycosyltransferase family 4 protein [Gammaproteobacteria bacterium]